MWLLLPGRILPIATTALSTNRCSGNYQYRHAFERDFTLRLLVMTSVNIALSLFSYFNLVICTENKACQYLTDKDTMVPRQLTGRN